MTYMLKNAACAQRVVKMALCVALALMAGAVISGMPTAEKAYADGQTAPMPDHVVMPKELVGKWSPDEGDVQPRYIEFRYDNGALVYYYYQMVYNLIGSGSLKDRYSDFEYNHGFVALQGNHGTCDCYLTNGKKVYESFYVDTASQGYIVKQDTGERFYKVGKPEKWRSYLNWPTKPDCYDSTTVATASGKTTLGPGAGNAPKGDKVNITNLSAANVSATNALLSATAYKDPETKVKNCGIYLGTSEATMQRENIEAVPDANNGYRNLNIWYDLNDELGITLEPHTTYYYAFYCEVGDEVYLSDTATFTTA